MSRIARIGAFFFEPDDESRRDAAPPPGAASDAASTSLDAARAASHSYDGPGSWTHGAVLGSDPVVVPVAAACAGELRARDRAAAATLCVWRAVPEAVGAVETGVEHAFTPFSDAVAPEETPAATAARERSRTPTSAATPGARRLAARLAAQDVAATACGRLAWVVLPAEPEAAVEQVERCLRAAAAPVVLAIACPRPAAFEPLLARLDLALAVLPADAEPALRALALASLPAREPCIVPPLPPGPPRWAAMAGLARLRSLPPLGGDT